MWNSNRNSMILIAFCNAQEEILFAFIVRKTRDAAMTEEG